MAPTGSGAEIRPEQLLGNKRKVTRADLVELIKIAKESQAQIVRTSALGAGDEPDDWCGTMWHPGPHVGKLVDALLSQNWVINSVLSHGIPPVIDGVVINFGNQVRGG